MPTIISHPAIVLALHPAFRLRPSIYVAGVICSVVPDFDVLGFSLGIHYGDLLGHRGFSHSLVFAAILSAAITFGFFRKPDQLRIFIFLFLCTVSHGILDALTNGGLGVAFFSPFNNVRYFFPIRPIEVSPIGISHFLSGPALSVLASEFFFVWLPCLIPFIIGILFPRKNLRS